MSALIRALDAVQWAIPIAREGYICPSCRYQKIRGHKCSCAIKLALRNAKRVIGDVAGAEADPIWLVEHTSDDGLPLKIGDRLALPSGVTVEHRFPRVWTVEQGTPTHFSELELVALWEAGRQLQRQVATHG